MEQEFKGQVVVVTGSAGALGRAVAARFRAAGALVVGFDRVAADGATVVDLLDAAATRRAVDAAAEQHGGIHVVCNIAGGFTMGETAESLASGREWSAMFDMNVTTLLHIAAATVPHLKRTRGAMVNIGAASALSGKAQMGAYVAAKSAVIRLTETLSAELREQGVNVNCVLPSIIDTPANRKDMPKADPSRWVAPGDLADVILFLASGRARAVHGAAVPVTGLS